MNITKHAVVSLGYTLTNDKGDILDQADAEHPFVYLHGANNIIPGLEHALADKTTGFSDNVTIAPELAYGLRDDNLTQQIPKEMFGEVDPAQLKPGARFHAQTDVGIETITIKAVDDTHVTIDANHPLAGETLHFDVTVLEIREATEEEIAHGHVHAGGSCGHDH